jgi:hypothetical protein
MMAKKGNFPDKSPKLKGALLRDLHKLNVRIRELIDFSAIDEEKVRKSWGGCSLPLTDKITARVQVSGLFNDIFSFSLIEADTGQVFHSEDIPSVFVIPRIGLPLLVRWNITQKGTQVIHRLTGPAEIMLDSRRISYTIKEVGYWEWGQRHSLTGPARTYLKDHRLRWEWWIRGQLQTPADLKEMLSNLHRIPKKEQMYLKLLHSRD